MNFKWSKAESEYFSRSILTAEYDYGWIGWLIVAITSLAGLGYFIWWVMR